MCPPCISTKTLQETVHFQCPTFLRHAWLELITRIYHVTSFQSCWNMCLCRLGFMYGSYLMMSHCIFFSHFGNSWTVWFWNSGLHDVRPTAWPAPRLIHVPYIVISGYRYNLLFMIQKSVTSRACNKEYIIDLRWLVRHWTFPASLAITLQACSFLSWSWRCTLWACSVIIILWPLPRKHISEGTCSCNIFYCIAV